jgi:hypothetical protein
MHLFVPGMTLKGIDFDEEWIKEQLRQKEKTNLKFSATGPGTEIWLCTESGAKVKNMDRLAQDALSRVTIAETPAKDVMIDLNDQNLFLPTGDEQIPLARIKSVTITISIGKIEQGIEIDTTEMVSVVLNNVLTKEQLFFDKALKPKGLTQSSASVTLGPSAELRPSRSNQ